MVQLRLCDPALRHYRVQELHGHCRDILQITEIGRIVSIVEADGRAVAIHHQEKRLDLATPGEVAGAATRRRGRRSRFCLRRVPRRTRLRMAATSAGRDELDGAVLLVVTLFISLSLRVCCIEYICTVVSCMSVSERVLCAGTRGAWPGMDLDVCTQGQTRRRRVGHAGAELWPTAILHVMRIRSHAQRTHIIDSVSSSVCNSRARARRRPSLISSTARFRTLPPPPPPPPLTRTPHIPA